MINGIVNNLNIPLSNKFRINNNLGIWLLNGFYVNLDDENLPRKYSKPHLLFLVKFVRFFKVNRWLENILFIITLVFPHGKRMYIWFT